LAKVSQIVRADARAFAATCGAQLRALSGTTLVVTGAAGFLCSFTLDAIAALNEVLDEPCHVIALDNFRTALPDRIEHLRDDPNFTFFAHDVTAAFEPSRQVHWILHGASIASPTFYRKFPLETIDANVSGTRRMLDLARAQNVRGYLQLSSSEIYGDPEPAAVPTVESYVGRVSCTGPRACYDESKRLGETLCLTYHRLFGTPVKIVRPFNVYGPGQRLDDARIIPDIVSAALEDRSIVLLSDGKATRAFCYVADFVRAMLLLLTADISGEAFNVGNDEELSMSRAAETMAEVAASKNVRVEYRVSADADYLTDNPQRRCPNLQKIGSATGFRPTVMLREGLERTLRSYREHAADFVAD
jgi:UDP-glucuronate decarboxylase